MRSIGASAMSARIVAKRALDDALVRPGGALHDGDRAIAAIKRGELGDHALERMHREMDGERRAGLAEIRERLALRHRGGAPRDAREHDGLGDLGQGQLAPERGGRRREGGHAGRDRVGDAEPAQAAQLLAHGAPHREIARMQPRHVLARGVGPREFGLDLVERHRRRVDDARAFGQWASSSFGTSEPA